MRHSVSKWLVGVACAAALGVAGAASPSDDAIGAAKDAASAATAAAKKAMDAVAGASSDAGAEALSAAREAAAAATRAAEAAEAAVAAATAAASEGAKDAKAAKAAPATVAAASGAKPYEGHVQCEGQNCKIDLFMTRGFRAFSQCQVCHGLDANGSSFAPSLVDRLKDIDEAHYIDVVTNGFTGQMGVMPAWGNNPNVMKHIDKLYAYLKARSDGVIPAGKLKRYDR